MSPINNWSAEDRDQLFRYLIFNSYRSKQHKLFYVATPKVACTSIKWWFAQLEGFEEALHQTNESAETDPDLTIHDTFHKIAPQVTGLEPNELCEVLTSDDYFRFAIVRNPYKRIFSAWQSKLLLQEPLQTAPYLTYSFFHLPLNTPSDIALIFEAFLEHLISHESPSFWDVHWTPQTTLLRPDLVDYTQLVQIENSHQLDKILANRLGSAFPHPLTKRKTNESLIPYFPELITPRADELIRELYYDDFKTFGYDLNMPASQTGISGFQFELAIQAIKKIRARHTRIAEARTASLDKISILECSLMEARLSYNQALEKLASMEHSINESNRLCSTALNIVTTLEQSLEASAAQQKRLEQEILAREKKIQELSQATSTQQVR
ncbi:MAG: sulfotransferase family 2 domain-containing protein [Proteobacteria bacterium]|nr:sulfotransferase family 2 domain-containing protein [Pseudomonadota bacterium]